jgi:uncharacterized protein YjaG (DUF416 family)
MELVMEQRICIKSCIKVRKAAAETYSMLHEACGDDALRQRQPTNGSNVLKIEELQWMMMSNLAELQLQDLNL